jgi:cell wall-associated NlpC family hydrolase
MRVRVALLLAAFLGVAGCAQEPVAPQEAAPESGPVRSLAPERSRAADAALFARAQLGSPYRFGGASPAGFDCSGLVRYSYGQAGVSLPRETREQRKVARLLEPDGPFSAGDLLFFHFGGKGALHVGLYVGNGEFVHAPASGGKVRVERLDAPHWKQRFIEARRIDPAS